MTNVKTQTIRTRIAPSPTGYPHIGTLYQALFNYAWAHKNNGQFIVRIEDTDRSRFVEDAEDVIFSMLDWASLSEDESTRKGGPYAPYRQSERLGIYRKYAKELVEKGRAYYCFCSKERLEELRKEQIANKQLPRYDKYCLTHVTNAEERIKNGESHVIRLNVQPNKKVWFDDIIRGRIEFDSNGIDDQVLIKSDGFPTYHLAVVVDDHLMKINYVIRGEEWIPSTPKHVILYESFGWELPNFCHTPDLRNPDKSKLSKRHGHTNVNWYKDEGYLPEAVLNYLALLGWTHPDEKEIFSLQEFIKVFAVKDVRAVGPVFDLQKLTWMNGVYIREVLSEEELKKRLEIFYEDDEEVIKILNGKHGAKFITAAKSRMKTLKDFKSLVVDTGQTRNYSEDEKELAKELSSHLLTLDAWTEETFLEAIKQFKEESGVNFKKIYFLLTGRDSGLPLTDLLTIYGKEYFLKNLKK